MRRMRRILFIGLLGTLLAGFAVFVLTPSEPSYKGKPLKYWTGCVRHGESCPDPQDPATKVIREMGPKALPVLLRYVSAHDSRFKLYVMNLELKWNLFPIDRRFAYQEHDLGLKGFYALGTNALPAVPMLTELLQRDDFSVRYTACRCLAYIGPEAKNAVPALIKEFEREAAETNALFPAALTLGKFGSNANAAIPVLEAALTNRSPDCRFYAQATLINLGVPAPQEFYWQLTNLNCQENYGKNLAKWCGTNAAPAIPVLVSGLKSPNYLIQSRCLTSIGSFHQQPELCVPAVLALLKSTNEVLKLGAMWTLGEFDQSAKQAGVVLAGCLDDPSASVRQQARFILPYVDPQTAKKHGLPPPTHSLDFWRRGALLNVFTPATVTPAVAH